MTRSTDKGFGRALAFIAIASIALAMLAPIAAGGAGPADALQSGPIVLSGDGGGDIVRIGPDGRAAGKVIGRIYFPITSKARAPLAGVFVQLGAIMGDGQWMWFDGCTNAKGVVKFLGVPANTDLVMASGPAIGSECENSEFLNPENGKKQYTVAHEGKHGVHDGWTTFTVDPDGRTVIRLVAKTPRNQKKVCYGQKTTWVGTNARDVYDGTDDRDVINALGGNDRIRGMGGVDIICLGPGNDKGFGNAGVDYLLGEGGKDYLHGGPDFDLMSGGIGTDTCVAGEVLASCEA